MANQTERDRKAINSQIRRQKAQEKRVDGVQERYQKIFDKHMREKYEDVSFHPVSFIKHMYCLLV